MLYFVEQFDYVKKKNENLLNQTLIKVVGSCKVGKVAKKVSKINEFFYVMLKIMFLKMSQE